MISRRNLLKATGAAAMSGDRVFAAFEEFFRAAPAKEATAQTILTACGVCSPACGMRATVKDGALTYLEGVPGTFRDAASSA
jgi:anaerobic selenocysteine-containing dehydrogenase